jgi:NDP-sugar pyrophosphorylase family protein
MSFEKSIREDLSNIPVLLFLGGEGTRVENLAYIIVVISKPWLPIGFDKNGEPTPLFLPTFKMLWELGFKEFYIIVRKDGERVKKYFEKKFKGEKVNIILLPDQNQNLSNLPKIDGINIYVFENDKAGIGDQILALKNIINDRPFLRVYGDEYFGGEKEKVKSEIKAFINYSLEKIEKEKAIEVFAFVDKKIAIGGIWEGLGIEGKEQSGKIIKTNESNFIITSICLASPEFFKILESEKKNSIPLDVASPEIVKKIIESEKAYGKVINVEVFSNVNTPEDYFKLISYIRDSNKQNKNNKIPKIDKEFSKLFS